MMIAIVTKVLIIRNADIIADGYSCSNVLGENNWTCPCKPSHRHSIIMSESLGTRIMDMQADVRSIYLS